MMRTISFTVPGEPAAWQRAGVSRRGKHYTPAKTRSFESRVRAYAMAAVVGRWHPEEGSRFAVHISLYRTHEGKGGDADNYAKAVKDAMNGVVYPDDRYVRDLFVRLRQDKANPRTFIIVHYAKSAEELPA